ncbi:hypothetical protein GEMRC1_012120 [Eukaryota sp. GEM-RC1]
MVRNHDVQFLTGLKVSNVDPGGPCIILSFSKFQFIDFCYDISMTNQRCNVRHKVKQFIVDIIGYSLFNHISQSGSKSINIHLESPDSWSMLPAVLFDGYSDGFDDPVLVKVNFPPMNPWLFFEVCSKFKKSGILSHKIDNPFRLLNFSGSLHIISRSSASLKHGLKSYVTLWKPGRVTIEGHQSVINPTKDGDKLAKLAEIDPRMIEYRPSPNNPFFTRATIYFVDEDSLSPSSKMSVPQLIGKLQSSTSHPCRRVAKVPVVMAVKIERGYEERGTTILLERNAEARFGSWFADVHAFFVLPDLNQLLQVDSACEVSKSIADQYECQFFLETSDYKSYKFSKEVPTFHFFKILPSESSSGCLRLVRPTKLSEHALACDSITCGSIFQLLQKSLRDRCCFIPIPPSQRNLFLGEPSKFKTFVESTSFIDDLDHDDVLTMTQYLSDQGVVRILVHEFLIDFKITLIDLVHSFLRENSTVTNIDTESCVFCNQLPDQINSRFSVCDHVFCRDCLNEYLKKSKKSTISLSCPKCSLSIGYNDFSRNIISSELSKSLEFRLRSYLNSYFSSKISICLNPDCRTLIPNVYGYVSCPNCFLPQCNNCGCINDDRHFGSPCDLYRLSIISDFDYGRDHDSVIRSARKSVSHDSICEKFDLLNFSNFQSFPIFYFPVQSPLTLTSNEYIKEVSPYLENLIADLRKSNLQSEPGHHFFRFTYIESENKFSLKIKICDEIHHIVSVLVAGVVRKLQFLNISTFVEQSSDNMTSLLIHNHRLSNILCEIQPIKFDSKQNVMAMIAHILVWKLECVIYGGFIRDFLLANAEARDIDCMTPTDDEYHQTVDKFLSEVRAVFSNVKFTKIRQNNAICTKTSFIVGDFAIDVDFTRPSGGFIHPQASPPFVEADVSNFIISKQELLSFKIKTAQENFSLDTTLRHCYNKEYVFFYDLAKYHEMAVPRLVKRIKSGWKCLSRVPREYLYVFDSRSDKLHLLYEPRFELPPVDDLWYCRCLVSILDKVGNNYIVVEKLLQKMSVNRWNIESIFEALSPVFQRKSLEKTLFDWSKTVFLKLCDPVIIPINWFCWGFTVMNKNSYFEFLQFLKITLLMSSTLKRLLPSAIFPVFPIRCF